MKAGILVAATTASGILGGVVGALLVQGTPPAPVSPAPASATAARDEALAKEVADLRARLDEMQSSVATANQDATKIRAELDREKRAAALARNRLESLEKGGAGLDAGMLIPGGHLEIEGASIRLASDTNAMGSRLKKTLDLMRKPEAERWTAIREALGLSDSQEEELKAALKERDLAFRDAMKVETHEVTGSDGKTTTAVTVAAPDPEKMRETRRRYDDRVNASLTPDQAKKWREDGYESAAGGGSSTTVISAVEWTEAGK